MLTDEEMVVSDRHQTAIHEAAHAVAYVVLGLPFEAASIRPGRGFAGAVVPGPRSAPPGLAGFDPWVSVLQQPPDLRADMERRIVVLLAGDVAGLYLADVPSTAYTPDEAEQIAEQALRALPSRIAELVVGIEEVAEPFETDEEQAHRLALAFAGPEVGPAYLGWLRTETAVLVTRYHAAIRRVAAALERRAALTHDEVAALVHAPRS